MARKKRIQQKFFQHTKSLLPHDPKIDKLIDWKNKILGGSPFIERIKNAMGVMAKGRCVQPGEGAFKLREVQSV